jgi:transcriptional regulator with XRE-family HTH domain
MNCYLVEVMSQDSPDWSLSAVVATQIRRLRGRREMNREQLAEACRRQGEPARAITAAAIANIETGRPDADGRRRRDVTIEELAIFARALDVPPVLLICPVGIEEEIEVLPGVRVSTWDAARWFAGEGYPFSSAEVSLQELEAGYMAGSAPIALYRKHFNRLMRYATLVDAMLFEGAEEGRAQRKQQSEEALRDVRAVRAEIRRHGLAPPVLPEQFEHIDDRRYEFLTPEDIEKVRASGRSYKVVDYRRVYDDEEGHS